MAKFSLGQAALIQLGVLVPVLGILGIPAWIYLLKGSPEELSYLVWISVGLLIAIVAIPIVTAIIYQSVTNSSIENSKLWKATFGKFLH